MPHVLGIQFPRSYTVRAEDAMKLPSAKRSIQAVGTLLTAALITGILIRAASASQTSPTIIQGTQFRGQVVSASGSEIIDGVNPGHPVAGATVYLVPVEAIDLTSKITASS